MNILTATAYLSLYPELLRLRRCLIRLIAPVVDLAELTEEIDHALKMACDCVMDNVDLGRPCGKDCPRLWRRLAGARGIGRVLWNSSLLLELEKGGWIDELGLATATTFNSPAYHMSWQFSATCNNVACCYLNRLEPSPVQSDYFVAHHQKRNHIMHMTGIEIQYRDKPVTINRGTCAESTICENRV